MRALYALKKVVVVVFALVSVFSAPSNAAPSRLQEIIDRGVLRVGTTGDWNPMTIRDPATNFYNGFDIDITTELAKDLGVTVEYIATDWKTLVSGVITDKYDMTGSAALNMKRARVAGYSQPYFNLAFVPIIQKQNFKRFRKWSDFNSSSVTITSTRGTVQESLVQEMFPKARHNIIQAPLRDYQQLLTNKATVIVTSNIEAATITNRFPQLTVAKVNGMRRPTPVAMLLPKEDQIWINYINHWIELKKTQGFFDRIARKWGLVRLDVR
ncbi:transporter substrate-binding domain-containing protein [Photobacterium sp. OFAV2-7]|uniref:transporter substrate-binding domain-containing protein n=1 Tax=Photobacterium sp. OFAV2-7 TaxID=2917748 RepID=UPI001EF624C9|nr:transporter substrate-binding domain-containing protein [Photobacterium sp. OFAV2-7]MCG7587143.1 transporter substrate-binding domain-containing protein [Photobacterium sp. OFAV2-7]